MIFVHKPRTAKMNTACAGILQNVGIRDVFARKITFQ